MNRIAYFLLIAFWVGIFLILYQPSNILLSKHEISFDLFREKLSETKAAKEYYKFKSNRAKSKLMKELSDGLSYLKNITILGRGESISAELMLEELSDFSPGLSKTYLSMARNLSLNEKTLASDALYEVTGNTYARDVGAFLASWEDIPQGELLSSIEAYLNVMREEQVTKQKSKDELISDLVYFPVVINCMLVLLNFIYVSYFIEQEEMLAQLFAF
ncbi:MAG: hypothetical protein Q4E99_02680 [Bacillota bacterium]|nr:hypothetical protein [Bacillota bacterium]